MVETMDKNPSSKTELLFLDSRQSDYIVRGVKIPGDEIRQLKSSKALGITFDEKLNFRTQFEIATIKATRIWNSIDPITFSEALRKHR